jgi:hypothetical protein
MISSVLVKKIFNLVKSFHFYGGLKLAKMPFLMDLVRRQKSLERAVFVTSPKALVKIRLSFHMQIYNNTVVHHIHTVRSFSESKKDG